MFTLMLCGVMSKSVCMTPPFMESIVTVWTWCASDSVPKDPLDGPTTGRDRDDPAIL